MSTILFQRPHISRFSHHGIGNYHQSCRTFVSPKMNLNFQSPQSRTKEDITVGAEKSSVPHLQTSRPSEIQIQFDQLQPSDHECDGLQKRDFGQFVAREAAIDEEYWTAAWLRAECHWEERPYERYVLNIKKIEVPSGRAGGPFTFHRDNYGMNTFYIDSFKRKFMDQEFHAIKKRCSSSSAQHMQSCTCIVAVKKDEKNVKRTVLKSTVGTLDLNIQYLLEGERFPGEYVTSPIFSRINRANPYRYGYVTNLCVAKYARRQGIAINMLSFAIESAKRKGVEQVYVHVDKANVSARKLYLKMGFQIVEMATPHLLEKYLLCFKA